jgi:hypothetical protein
MNGATKKSARRDQNARALDVPRDEQELFHVTRTVASS